jgi:hypothetical protein
MQIAPFGGSLAGPRPGSGMGDEREMDYGDDRMVRLTMLWSSGRWRAKRAVTLSEASQESGVLLESRLECPEEMADDCGQDVWEWQVRFLQGNAECIQQAGREVLIGHGLRRRTVISAFAPAYALGSCGDGRSGFGPVER